MKTQLKTKTTLLVLVLAVVTALTLTCGAALLPANNRAFAAAGSVSFSAGEGGSGTGPQGGNYADGEVIVLPQNTFTREGYIFTGWLANGTTYHSGDSYTVTGDVEFVAQWTAQGNALSSSGRDSHTVGASLSPLTFSVKASSAINKYSYGDNGWLGGLATTGKIASAMIPVEQDGGEITLNTATIKEVDSNNEVGLYYTFYRNKYNLQMGEIYSSHLASTEYTEEIPHGELVNSMPWDIGNYIVRIHACGLGTSMYARSNFNVTVYTTLEILPRTVEVEWGVSQQKADISGEIQTDIKWYVSSATYNGDERYLAARIQGGMPTKTEADSLSDSAFEVAIKIDAASGAGVYYSQDAEGNNLHPIGVGTYRYVVTDVVEITQNNGSTVRHSVLGNLSLSEGATQLLTISPAQISVGWGGLNVSYNDDTHTPTATILETITNNSGAALECAVEFERRGEDKSAPILVGEYEYIVTDIKCNGVSRLEQFAFVTGQIATMVIAPAEEAISWSGDISVSYNGMPHLPTAEFRSPIKSTDGRTEKKFTLVLGLMNGSGTDITDWDRSGDLPVMTNTCIDVGSYNFFVAYIYTQSANELVYAYDSYYGTIENNFYLTGNSVTMSIKASQIIIDWFDSNDNRISDVTIYYNGNVQLPVAKIREVLNGSENIRDNFTVNIAGTNATTGAAVERPVDAENYIFSATSILDSNGRNVNDFFIIESGQKSDFSIKPLVVSFMATDKFTSNFNENDLLSTVYGSDVKIDRKSLFELDLIGDGYFSNTGANNLLEDSRLTVRLRRYDMSGTAIATVSSSEELKRAATDTYKLELTAVEANNSGFKASNYTLTFDDYRVVVSNANITLKSDFAIAGYGADGSKDYDQAAHDIISVTKDGTTEQFINAIQIVNPDTVSFTVTFRTANLDFLPGENDFESVGDAWVPRPVSVGSVPQIVNAGYYALEVTVRAANHNTAVFYYAAQINKVQNSLATLFGFVGSENEVYPYTPTDTTVLEPAQLAAFDLTTVQKAAWTFGVYDGTSNVEGYNQAGNQKVVAPVLRYTLKKDGDRQRYNARIWQYNGTAWEPLTGAVTQTDFSSDTLIQQMINANTFYAGYYAVQIFTDAGSSDNFTDFSQFFVFKVDKKTVTIKAKNVRATYGDDVTPDVEIIGMVKKDLINGTAIDKVADLIESYSASIVKRVGETETPFAPNKENGSVGEYVIKSEFTGTDYFNANYEAVVDEGTLTVVRRQVVIRIDNKDNYYQFQGANNTTEVAKELTYSIVSGTFAPSDLLAEGSYTFDPAENVFYLSTEGILLNVMEGDAVARQDRLTSKTVFKTSDGKNLSNVVTNNQGQWLIDIEYCEGYDQNYEITQSGTGYYIIKSAVFGISWGLPYTKVDEVDTMLSSQLIEYSGKEYWYDPAVSGFKLDLDVVYYKGSVSEANKLAGKPVDAGSYIAVATVKDNTQGDNFQTSSAQYSFSIAPATVVVTAQNATIQYAVDVFPNGASTGVIDADKWAAAVSAGQAKALGVTFSCASYELTPADEATFPAVSYTTDFVASGANRSQYAAMCVLTPQMDETTKGNFTFTFRNGSLTVQRRKISVTMVGATVDENGTIGGNTYAQTVYTGADATAQLNSLYNANKAAFLDNATQTLLGTIGDSLDALQIQLSFLRGVSAVNVGTYGFEAYVSAAATTNYDVSFANTDTNRAKFVITKKALTVTPVAAATVPYGNQIVLGTSNGAANTMFVGYNFEGFVTGDSYESMGSDKKTGSLVLTTGGYVPYAINAGTTVTLSFDGTALSFVNYDLTCGTATVTVEKRALTATVAQSTFNPTANPFVGSELPASVTLGGVDSGFGYNDSYKPTFTLSYSGTSYSGTTLTGGAVPSLPGEYNVTVTLTNDNYSLATTGYEYIVNKAELSTFFYWQASEVTYNGTNAVQNVALGFHSSLFDTSSISVVWNTDGSDSGTELSADEIHIDSANNKVTVDVVHNGWFVATATLQAGVGNYYALDEGQTTCTIKFEAVSASVSIEISIVGWTYGNAANSPTEKDGKSPAYTYQMLTKEQFESLKAQEGLEEGYGTVPSYLANKYKYELAAPQNAGAYIVRGVYSEGDSGNAYSYYLFTIAQCPVAVPTLNVVSSGVGKNDTYTGTTLNMDLSYDFAQISATFGNGATSAFVRDDSNQITADRVSVLNAGSYAMTFTLNDTDNYVWGATEGDANLKANGTYELVWTVDKAENSVSFNSTAKVTTTYGTDFTDPAATATFGTVRYQYSTNGTDWSDTRPKDAGTYSIKAVVDGNNNYEACATGATAENKNVTLEIGKKTLKVVASGSATYGDTYGKSIWERNFEGFVYGEGRDKVQRTGTPVYIVNGTTIKDTTVKVLAAGSYDVYVSATNSNNENLYSAVNYDFDFTSTAGKFVVSKKDVTLKVGSVFVNYSVPYKAKLTVANLLVSEDNNNKLANGEKVAGVLSDSSVTFICAADSLLGASLDYTKVSVGSYGIFVTGYTAANYNITFNNGILIVNQLEVTVTLTATNATYGAIPANYAPVAATFALPESGATFDTANIEPSFTYTKATINAQGAITGYTSVSETVAKSQAGTYSATVSLTDNNLRLSGTTFASYTINKQTLDETKITVNSAVFDGNPHTPAITDNTYGAYYTVSGLTAQTNAGSYPVTLTLKEPENVQWKNASGAVCTVYFDIAKAQNSGSVTITGWTYGSPAKAPSSTFTFAAGTVAGAVSYEYSADNGTTWSSTVPTNAGNYLVRAKVAENENVKACTSSNAQFTIAKQQLAIPTVVTDSTNNTYTGELLSANITLPTNAANNRIVDVTNENNVTVLYESVSKVLCQVTTAGTHSLTLTIFDPNYIWVTNSNEATVDWVVAKATNEITVKRIEVTYGDDYTLTANVKFGDASKVNFTYYDLDGITSLVAQPRSAGTYKVKAKLEGTGNWDACEVTVEAIVINKKQLTVTPKLVSDDVGTALTGDIVFDSVWAKAPKFAYEISGFIAGESEGVVTKNESFAYVLTKGGTTVTPHANLGAGDYVLTLAETSFSATNYSFNYTSTSFTVNKLKLDENNVTTTNGTYTNANQSASNFVATSGNIGTYTANAIEKVSANAAVVSGTTLVDATVKNAGTYQVKFTISDTANVEWTNTTGADYTVEFEIAKAQNSGSVTITGWTYGDAANTPTIPLAFTEQSVGYKYSDNGGTTWSDTVPTNAGSYLVKAVGSETANVNAFESAPVSFAIAKKAIGYTLIGAQESYVYTGAEQSLKVQYNNGVLFANNVNTPTVDNSADDGWTLKATNAGDYYVNFTLLDSNNYVIENGKNTLKWTIASVTNNTVSFTTAPVTAVYGDEYTITATANFGTVQYQYKTQGGADWTNDRPTNVGNYTVRAFVEGNSNYNSCEATQSLTISKKSLTVVPSGSVVYGSASCDNFTFVLAEGSTLAYGETLESVGVNMAYGVVIGADGAETIAESYNTLNVGDYKLGASGETANYTFSGIASDGFKVEKRAVTLQLGNHTVVYGQTIDLSGVSVTLSEGTLANEDGIGNLGTVTFAHTGAPDTYGYIAKGSYDITGSLTGANGNYAVTVNNGTLAVSALEIEFAYDITSPWTYGDSGAAVTIATVASRNANVDFSGNTALVNALKALTLNFAGTTFGNESYDSETLPTNAGNYKVSVSNLSENFTLSESSFVDFTIGKKAIDESAITIAPQTYTGSALTPVLTDANNMGAYYTDNIASLNVVNAGNHNVTLTLTDANYKWATSTTEECTVTFTVEKATVTVVISDPISVTYGNLKVQPDKLCNHTVSVDSMTSLPESVTITFASTAIVGDKTNNVGSYPITATISDTNNYTLTYNTDKSVTVTPAKISLPALRINATGDDKNDTYTGNLLSAELINYSAEVEIVSYSDDLIWAASNSKFHVTNAGTYTIEFKLVSSNYVWSDDTTANKTVIWEVKKATVEITSLGMSKENTYTGKPFEATPSVNVVNGTVKVEYFNKADGTKLDAAPTNVGSYKVVASVDETDNYSEANATFEFAITPATLTVTPSGSMTYGAAWESGTFSYVITGFVDGKTQADVTAANVVYAVKDQTAGAAVLDADNYGLTITGSFSLANYTFTLAEGKFVVNKLVIDESAITIAPQTFTGSALTPVLTDANNMGAHYTDNISSLNVVNAGSHNVTLTLKNTSNTKWKTAEGATCTVTFTVNKGTNSIVENSFNVTGWTYGDTPIEPSVAVTFDEDTATKTFKYSADGSNWTTTVPTNAGTYYVKVEVAETANCVAFATEKDENVTITINRKVVDLPDWKEGKGESYTGNLLSAELIYDQTAVRISSYNENLILEANNRVFHVTNAGDYNITLELVSNNYVWNDSTTSEKTIQWIVAKAVVTLEIPALGGTYTGNPFEAAPSVNVVTNEISIVYYKVVDGVDTKLDAAPTNVGSYKVVASVDETDNYSEANATFEFAITPAMLTVTPSGSMTYGAAWESGTFSYVITGFVDGKTQADVTAANVVYAVKGQIADAVLNADNYGLTITGSFSLANYTFTLAEGEFDVNKLVIDESAITIAPQTFTGSALTPVLTDANNMGAHYDNNISELTIVNVDSYDVTLTLKDAHNYKWATSTTEECTVTFTVNKGTNSIVENSFEVTDWTYGDTPIEPGVAVTFDNATATKTFKYSADGSNWTTTVPTNAGTYYVKVEVAETANCVAFATEKDENVTITISRKSVTLPTVVTDSTNDTYTGNTLTLNITLPEGAALTSTEGIKVYYVTSSEVAFQVTDAKEYSIGMGLVSVNYVWSDNTTAAKAVTWKVNPATTVITAEDVSVTYGENYNVSASSSFGTPVYKYSDDNGATWKTDKPRNAGSYKVQISVEGTNNYNGATVVKNITIQRATLTVVPTGSIVYGQSVEDCNNFSYTLSGFVGQDNVTNVTVTGKIEQYLLQNVAEGKLSAGSYKLVVKQTNNVVAGLSAANYVFVSGEGTFTVEKRNISVNVQDVSAVYSDSFELTYSLNAGSTLADGDTLDDLRIVLSVVANRDNFGFVPYGSYTIEGSNTENKNYNVSYSNGRLNVTQLTLDVDFNVQDGAYNGTRAAVSVKSVAATGRQLSAALQEAIKSTITLAYSGTTFGGENVYGTEIPTKAGNYVVTVSQIGANFAVSQASSAQFTVARYIVDESKVKVDSQVYTGAKLTPSITDTALYTVSFEANIVKVGSYDVTLTLRDSDNMQWKGVSGATATTTFNVTKAQNEIVEALTITGWVYGNYNSATNAPKVALKYDSSLVRFTYSSQSDGEYTDKVPSDSAAGTYFVRVEMAETENCVAFTSEPVKFTISKKTVEVPTLEYITEGEGRNNIYTGEELNMRILYDTTLMRITSGEGTTITALENGAIIHATNANLKGYEISFSLIDNVNNSWENSVSGSVVLKWVVARKQIEKPDRAEKVTFFMDGTTHNYEAVNFDSKTMTMIDGSKVEAGRYTAVVTITDKTNYEWSNGTQEDVSFTWNIIGQGVIFAIVFGTLGTAALTVGGVFVGRIVKHKRMLKNISAEGSEAAGDSPENGTDDKKQQDGEAKEGK